MIITLKQGTTDKQVQEFTEVIKSKGLGVHVSKGENLTIVGVLGDTSKIEPEQLEVYSYVESAKRISAPYKMANRSFHPENTIIKVGNTSFGGDEVPVIAGPCSVESEEQLVAIAKAVKASGAKLLRGGAFKPRTSPYSFQGLGKEGLRILSVAKKETGLPIVSEVMEIRQIELFDDVDVIQVGARNTQNFDLLKELGKTKKPILLKRGIAGTVKELLMSAEYIMASGNENVILCERGIRSYDNYTRNCFDVSVVPYLHKVTHLPVVVDPSHACGIKWMVGELAKAGVACNADGLEIEVHNHPELALSDGEQALLPTDFDDLMKVLPKLAEVVGRKM